MNKERRCELRRVLTILARVGSGISNEECAKLLKEAALSAEAVQTDEESAADNLPDSLYWSEMACNMRDNVSALFDIVIELEELKEMFEEKSEPINKRRFNKLLKNAERQINEIIDY